MKKRIKCQWRTCVAFVFATVGFSAQAFEVDVTHPEAIQRLGYYTVGQLATSQRGFVYSWALCYENDGLYVQNLKLVSDPYDAYIELVRLPSGGFDANFLRNRDGELAFSVFQPCLERTDARWQKWPIETLNGYSRYSDWLDYMKTTYEFAN